MAAAAEKTSYREVINERGERILVAEKDTVVTVELEPGVYGTHIQKETAFITLPKNKVDPAPSTTVVITDDTEIEERSCCEKAWHCDKEHYLNPVGKGPAWIPFYIILWIFLIILAAALIICICPMAILGCFADEEKK